MNPTLWHVTGLPEIVVRASVIYIALLVGLRLMGKRELGQMTLFDLVVILLISNAVQNAMVGDNNTLPGGLTAAATLLGWDYVVGFLRYRSTWFSDLIAGTPTTIVEDGAFLTANMAKETLREDEVLMAMREHGIENLSEVKRARLETDGSISVIPTEAGRSFHKKKHRRVRFLKHG